MMRWSRYAVYGLLLAMVIWAFPGVAQREPKAESGRRMEAILVAPATLPIDLITRDNFKDLQVAWSWRFDNFGGGTSETTPIMVNGILILPSASGGPLLR